MLRKPEFIVVGVGRSGTTSLFEYLRQHPNIYLPKIKEPKYFSHPNPSVTFEGPGDSTVKEKIITDKKIYYSLFEQAQRDQIIGEASSDYFYYWEESIPRIREEIGDPRIIICLRHPVERAWSAYNNLRRDGREKLSFERALSSEPARMDAGWDWMWAYVGGSMYWRPLREFLEQFSDVNIVLFEDLAGDPIKTTREVYRFLGVADSFEPRTGTAYSRGGEPKNAIFKWILSRDNSAAYQLRKTIQALLPRPALEAVTQRAIQQRQMDKDVEAALNKQFKSEIDRLEELTNFDLSGWRL